MHHIMFAQVVVTLEQSGTHLLPRLTPDAAEAQSQYELSVASREVDLSRAGDVSVFRARVLPFHLEMLGKVLPSVGSTHKSDRHLFPRRRAGKRERRTIVLSQKHGQAFVISNPSGIAVTKISQVRRK